MNDPTIVRSAHGNGSGNNRRSTGTTTMVKPMGVFCQIAFVVKNNSTKMSFCFDFILADQRSVQYDAPRIRYPIFRCTNFDDCYK